MKRRGNDHGTLTVRALAATYRRLVAARADWRTALAQETGYRPLDALRAEGVMRRAEHGDPDSLARLDKPIRD